MTDFHDVEVFPEIAPNDYAAFRQIIHKNMPDTHDEWSNLQTKEIREFDQAGRHTRRVPVNPHEFARFLHLRGANANLSTLRDFANEINAGNRY
jgi:hypothetical protein